MSLSLGRPYDYLVVGAGLFGSVFAYEAGRRGKKVLVLEKRNHIGGNIYCEEMEGIQVHRYGAHIFHTNKKEIWDYMNQFAEFNRYTNSPVAVYKGEYYNLPFNMNTFHQLWGVKTPAEAKAKLDSQRADAGESLAPENLEEQAISLVGKDIYVKLIEGYTRKQWGKKPAELPAFIIKRLPVRFTYDNNYFNDRYQGIPVGGYTKMIQKMLVSAEVRLEEDFFDESKHWRELADTIVFTGMIDEFYDYRFGELEYRSLRFETEVLDEENYQGNAVINYTEYEVPYTRIIEHKHFEFGTQEKTVITREYPAAWERGKSPYYPINNERNNSIYQSYAELAQSEKHVIFGGRLSEYKYYDMHQVVECALSCVNRIFKEEDI